MDCKKADQLMMKYMDMTILKEEKILLDEHLGNCELCREAFTIYDEMMDHFSGIELIEAPENFEALVMEKIAALPKLSGSGIEPPDNPLHVFWGIASVLLGLGTIAAINNDAIIQYLSSTNLLSVAAYMNAVVEDVSLVTYNVFGSFNSFMSEAKYYMVAVLLFIISLQVFVYRKDKVEA